jgi:hypothetical protein
MRFLRAFGAFWYDFLVGDRPELFLGSIAVLALASASVRAGLDPALAGVLLAVGLLALGWVSLAFATRRRA